MSNSYAKFIALLDERSYPKQAHEMYVNAFIRNGKSIQLTFSGGDADYITLSEKQVKDLIDVLQARLDGKVTATGSEDMGDFEL